MYTYIRRKVYINSVVQTEEVSGLNKEQTKVQKIPSGLPLTFFSYTFKLPFIFCFNYSFFFLFRLLKIKLNLFCGIQQPTDDLLTGLCHFRFVHLSITTYLQAGDNG